MATTQSTRELISKHKVLTGFSRFMYFALVAIAINIADSLYGPYKDYRAVYILSIAASLLLISLLLYKKKYALPAVIISAITFNLVFFLIAIHIGYRAGTNLYFFPFILAYIYLFRAEGYRKYVPVFTIISVGVLVLSQIVAPYDPPVFKVPDAKMKSIFFLTFLISFSLTIYFFTLIYKYQEQLYNRILELEKNNRIQQLRSIIESRESDIQKIVYELRNNINQTLAASKVFLEEYVKGGENRDLVTKSQQMTSEAMNALAILCTKLHPAIITDIGFIDGIREYIAELKKISSVQIHFECNNNDVEETDDMDKISIFRIIQDYLTLILNNPATSWVTIKVSYLSPLLHLTLRQNDTHFNFMKTGQASHLNEINNRITYLKGSLRQKQEGNCETTIIQFTIG